MNESFSAIIHDLKNPVANIRAIHELLNHELNDTASERCCQMLEMLRISYIDAEQLIQQLMETAVMGTHHLTVHPQK